LLHYNEDEHEMNSQARLDEIRYKRMLKGGQITIDSLIRLKPHDYSLNDYFFMKMYLAKNVPFLGKFDS